MAPKTIDEEASIHMSWQIVVIVDAA